MTATDREQLEQLEQVLRELHGGHRDLLACIEDKRRSLRAADLDALEASGRREQAITARLDVLERRRRSVIERIGGDARTTIRQIAADAGEPHGTRLLALGGELRRLVDETRRETTVVRAAAEALSQHMTGLLQTVRATLGRAGVYGRQGAPAHVQQVTSGLDVRT